MGWLFLNSVLININCMLRFEGCLAFHSQFQNI